MKSPCLWPVVCWLLPAFSAFSEEPVRQECRIENVAATNHSVQQSAVFSIAAGARVTIQLSNDLAAWTNETSYYSLGGEFVFPMRQFAAPPPPDPDAPPVSAGPPHIANVSLRLQPSSGESGGIVASWPSLDDGRAVTVHLAKYLAPEWLAVPLFFESFDGYEFFVSHPPDATAPPAENSVLGEKDAAMLAVLDARLADMNAIVTASAARSRNTPPPAPSSPGSRKFFRAFKTFPDSDGDGSTDAAEFEIIARRQTAAGIAGDDLADPFDADKNRDGIPDGQQLDQDGDQTPDASDAAPQDPTMTAPVGEVPRFAFFPLPGSQGTPVDINTRGTVLFPRGTWKGGDLKDLEGTKPPKDDRVATALNDHDQILGQQTREFPDPSNRHAPAGCYWPGRSGPRTWVEAEVDCPVHGKRSHSSVYPETRQLGNDGYFRSETWSFQPGPSMDSCARGAWRLPAGEESTCQSLADGSRWSEEDGIRLMEEPGTEGFVIYDGARRLPELPGGGGTHFARDFQKPGSVLAVGVGAEGSSNLTTYVSQNGGGWTASASYENALYGVWWRIRPILQNIPRPPLSRLGGIGISRSKKDAARTASRAIPGNTTFKARFAKRGIPTSPASSSGLAFRGQVRPGRLNCPPARGRLGSW
jgi:hypothetical protein